MPKLFQVFVILIIGVLVAVADMLIKKASDAGTFLATLKHPLMLWVLILYIAQTLLAIYIFLWKWDLGISINGFIVFYSITGIILGYLIFKEHLSLVQYIGIAMALFGVILMNR